MLATNAQNHKVTESVTESPLKCESDQEPGTLESPRLLELDLSLNQISKVPQLQNLPALEWLSLEVFLGPRGPLGTPSFVRPSVRPSAQKIWINCTAL